MSKVDLIETFLMEGPATSAQIAAALGLSRQTVSSTMSNLIVKRRIVKVGVAASDGPTPLSVYALNEPPEVPPMPADQVVASAIANRSPLELAWAA
jgi:predicted ArsR family transcriptional regulator